jgi:hypothetical protein
MNVDFDKIFKEMIETIRIHVTDDYEKTSVYEEFVDILTEYDVTDLADFLGCDPVFDKVIRKNVDYIDNYNDDDDNEVEEL